MGKKNLFVQRDVGAVATPADARALEKTPPSGRFNLNNSYEALQVSARDFPEKPALVFLPAGTLDEACITYSFRHFLAGVTQTANLFCRLGIGRDDAVLILAPPYPGTYFSLFAAQACGISVTANPFLSLDHLAGIAASARARVIVTVGPDIDADIWQKSLALASRVDRLETVVIVAGEPDDGALDLAAALKEEPAGRLLFDDLPASDDIAAYFHTGGTTGAPKLAKLTHLNQLCGAWSNAAMLDFDAGHITPNGLPLFHVGGAVVIAFRSFLLGQTLVQMTAAGFRSPAVTRNIWQLAEKYGFTQLIGVPTNFIDWYPSRPEDGRTPVRYFSVGATKPPPDLFELYQGAFGRTLHEGYGMTEFSGWCAANPMAGQAKPGTSGFAVPWCELRVFELDRNGNFSRECGAGEVGSIAVCGPAVFAGYVDETADADKFIEGGPSDKRWMNTGDLGWLDEAGYLRVTGRQKDLIIRGGHNIDPAVIDDVLNAHPDVEEAAAVGMPDRRVGELPVAFVKKKDGASVDGAALLAHCHDGIAERAAVPVKILFVDEMPRTVMGKLFKPRLRQIATEYAVGELIRAELPQDIAVEVTTEVNERSDAVTVISLEHASDPVRSMIERALMHLPGAYEIRTAKKT